MRSEIEFVGRNARHTEFEQRSREQGREFPWNNFFLFDPIGKPLIEMQGNPSQVAYEQMFRVSEVRDGSIDATLLAYCEVEIDERDFLNLSNLGKFIQYCRKAVDDFQDGVNKSEKSREYPHRKILEFLAHLGSEEHFFAYTSRFVRFNSEEMACAIEYMQVSPFNEFLNRDRGRSLGVSPGEQLKFFRMAQKIRDERGITCKRSIEHGFTSLEDIIAMERELANNNAVPFMTQCIALGLVDNRHFEAMYSHARTRFQLNELHGAFIKCNDSSLQFLIPRVYASRFHQIGGPMLDLFSGSIHFSNTQRAILLQVQNGELKVASRSANLADK